MHLFYSPQSREGIFTLDSSESAHCTRVLRLVTGDTIYLTDGKGRMMKARIIKPDKKACMAEIVEIRDTPTERVFSLEIAIAPTKNTDRFEWFLEKSVEIGIDRIIPLLCKNSERRTIKHERLSKVMIAAMKQSLSTWLPEITPLATFEELVERPFDGTKLIATGSAGSGNNTGKLYKPGSDALILIGPEGDFSDTEMDLAREKGFLPVSLSDKRLRTETAGLVACHSVNLLNELH